MLLLIIDLKNEGGKRYHHSILNSKEKDDRVKHQKKKYNDRQCLQKFAAYIFCFFIKLRKTDRIHSVSPPFLFHFTTLSLVFAVQDKYNIKIARKKKKSGARAGKDYINMQLQRLLSFTRKAVDEYELIQENDHIAVGISGGKDSLTLLYALHGLKRFYPKKFELSAVSVDLGFEDFNLSPVAELCKELEVPYKIVKSDIYHILFDIRKETNPCSLCAKMRKGALNEAVKEMGCNKVAYAHHKDDIVETMLLSLLFEGRFYSFSPRTYLDRMDLTVIRPTCLWRKRMSSALKTSMRCLW